ncbi:MAG: GH116 family glycosyl-hydrolase [Hydrogeniiclostridium mannosilyticum]
MQGYWKDLCQSRKYLAGRYNLLLRRGKVAEPVKISTAYLDAKSGFRSRFPFAEVELEDPVLPVTVSVTAWSPFIPGNEDDSSLPAGFLTFCFYNVSDHP